MISKIESKNKIGVVVSNNVKVLGFLVDLQMKAYREGRKSLLSNLTDDMTRIFGKNTNSFLSEFKHKIWTLQYKDLIFNIFCSKRGTSIEICNYDYDQINKGERESDITEFLEELYNTIK